MEKFEPFDRLLRYRLLLKELTLEIEYKERNPKIQTSALSRLNFFGYTTKALDKNIPAYSDDVTLIQEQVGLVYDSDVVD